MNQQSRIIGSIAVVVGMLLAGCNRTGDVPRPTTAAAGTSAGEGKSVALPPSQRPPSDASIPPAPPTAATTSNDEKQSQAVSKDISKQQESSSMPMAGQVNNHSVPAGSSAKQ
jgi:hypothetical protein